MQACIWLKTIIKNIWIYTFWIINKSLKYLFEYLIYFSFQMYIFFIFRYLIWNNIKKIKCLNTHTHTHTYKDSLVTLYIKVSFVNIS